ncbi:MAG TPA: iron ABC transporter permease [Planctomycetota bacterium]|jgi:iron complex transport system permease protein|nr:iron ABC transporter permease [Planctomycetota bacterium]HPY73957.1 iron ABC transporter permease [Planctomycetota bacterium]HQA99580.1 iron ABC transporter permease [Planctomycetota bacterium]
MWKKIFVYSLCFLVPIFSICIGRYSIHFMNIYEDIVNLLQGKILWSQASVDIKILFYRIPRIGMAMLVGAGLASSGMVYQCLFRNPLVSPDILGISSGACLGAAIAILCNVKNPWMLQLTSFSFGIFAVFLTYRLATYSQGHSTILLVMAGIVISSLCNALLSLLKYLADPFQELPAIIFWIMGGFHQIGFQELFICTPTILLGLLILYLFRHQLNLLSLGDKEAQSLGLNVRTFHLLFICTGTCIVGATISMTGTIGWIGLVIPHITRLLFGTDHTTSLPMTMLLGGIFMVSIDTLTRTMSSQEIPIGILTSLIGAPFFAYLLVLQPEKGWKQC